MNRLTLLLLLAASPLLGQSCPDLPIPAGVTSYQKICHADYISFYDPALKIPRLVVYSLSAEDTLGCTPRATTFYKEGDSASPSDYSKTGYDLGHMKPAQDSAATPDSEHDSFSMVNVAPQLPGLNRQEWERLEETVRAWTISRKTLLVYVGPVVKADDKKVNGVDVPSAFFKVVVATNGADIPVAVQAFEMPQKSIPKGDLTPWLTLTTTLQSETGITLPEESAQDEKMLWPADISAWHAAHKSACADPEPPSEGNPSLTKVALKNKLK